MKNILTVILILISVIVFPFSLREFVTENECEVEYDPEYNLIKLSWQNDVFIFIPNEDFYYKGINVYRLSDKVIFKDNDFHIPDDFLRQWKKQRGIYRVEFSERSKKINCNFLSESPIKYEKIDDLNFKIMSGDYSLADLSGINLIEKGIERMNFTSNYVNLRFIRVTNIEIKTDKNSITFSYSLREPEKPKVVEERPVVKYVPPVFDRKKLTVVIDPGHGGKDPGAIGVTGTREKDIVLPLSRLIARDLKKLGYNVLMTRTTDVFIPLRSRTNFANKNNADLFVSVHANFSHNRRASGFDIYYLSKSASDDESRAVAAFENKVIELEEEEQRDLLGEIIWSMLANEFENESIVLSGTLAKNIRTVIPPNGNPVKHARFYVLFGATMPAVLIESGFLSNREDEKKLKTASFQEKLAENITKAIDEYFSNNYRKFIK